MAVCAIGEFKAGQRRADPELVRSVTGMCVGVGCLVGGFVPALWGDSGFSLAALLTTALGGAAGLWLGARLSA